MNILNDYKKPFTAEDLIRRYNLDGLTKDRKNIKTLNDGLTKVDTIIEDYIKNVTNYVENQADNSVATWFFAGIPTLENEPFINFESKQNHIDDFYYDQDSGEVYQLKLINDAFTWQKIDDDKLKSSLALANSASDAKDNKRELFYSQPQPPYSVGDIWYDNGSIKRCRCSRESGEYNHADWCYQKDYTDECVFLETHAILNQFIETVERDYATNVKLEATKNSIEASVSSLTTETNKIASDVATLKLTTSSISSTVSSKVGKDEIISRINQTAEEIKINANKISLEGKNIDLTTDNITISSNKLKIDKEGNLTSQRILIENGFLFIRPASSASSQSAGILIGANAGISNTNVDVSITPFGVILGSTAGSQTSIRYDEIEVYDDSERIQIVPSYGTYVVTQSTSTPIGIFNNVASKTGSYMTIAGMWSPAFNNTSLESKKKNITLDEGCLEEILNTDIVNFNWNFEDDTDKKHIGLVIPDKGGNYRFAEKALTHDRDAVELYSMIGMAWKAIQELEERLHGIAKDN